MGYRRFFTYILRIVLVTGIIIFGGHYALADTVSDLQQKISAQKGSIEALEKEIAQYEKDLVNIGKEKNTLKNTVQSLELNQKKLETDISLTENKIDGTNLEIERLGLEINTKESDIGDQHTALAQSMRLVNEVEETSLIEVMLSNNSLAEFLGAVDQLAQLQSLMQGHISDLRDAKTDLEGKVTESQKKKAELVSLTNKLSDQKQIVVINKNQQQSLLKDTQNKESQYQATLTSKKKLKEAFEQELLDYESQLKIAIDLSQLPSRGTAVLSWPLAKIQITQFFGDTEFSRTGAYNGKGHNGIDLGASIGTPLMAAAEGTVVGTGDTDLACPGASYGRWVLIQHKNGLSTLYGHLSLIKVSSGDTVSRGSIIGYSGNTGYTTGPHLHFTVFATQGVQVGQLKSKVCSATYTLPLASLNAYLNPMDYLPPAP